MSTPPRMQMPVRRQHRHRHHARGIPAPVVFYLSAALAMLCAGAVFALGKLFVALSAVACLLLIGVLYMNDHRGFIQSRQMRRAFQAKRHFSVLQVIILFGLIMFNILVAAYRLIG